jgi:hypothetical protein
LFALTIVFIVIRATQTGNRGGDKMRFLIATRITTIVEVSVAAPTEWSVHTHRCTDRSRTEQM